jgi:plastocyanin
VIHRTAATPRSLAWMAFALGGTLLLMSGAACGRTSYSAGRSSTRSRVPVASRMPLGMDMTPAPEAQAPSVAGDNQVTIQNFSFGPGSLTVSAGATVTWTNSDSVTHTVTASDASFDSSNLKPGEQFSFKFSAPGTYSYHCSIHPFMTGQIVVQ